MTSQHVHLMFGMEEQGILKAALHKAEIRHDHKVFSFNDWFAYGPLEQLQHPEGETKRVTWLSERLSNYERLYMYNPDHQTRKMVEILQALPDDTNLRIWHSNHAHDQIGVRFVLSLLSNRQINITLINPLQSVEGTLAADQGSSSKTTDTESVAISVVTPVSLSELKAADYIPYLQQMNDFPILTLEERAVLEKEWEQLSTNPALFRIWEHGLIRCCSEDVLDEVLMEVITEQSSEYADQYVPASKVVSEVLLRKPTYSLRKDFLEYRLRSLIMEKQIRFKGAPGQLHRYRVTCGTEEAI